MMKPALPAFGARQNIGLVGIGAMTRMIAKAYRMADAIRAVGRAGGDGRSSRHGRS